MELSGSCRLWDWVCSVVASWATMLTLMFRRSIHKIADPFLGHRPLNARYSEVAFWAFGL